MNTQTQSHASRKLELYVTNTSVYLDQIKRFCIKHLKDETFTLDKGIKGAMRVLNQAAKQYTLEYGSMTDKWSRLFSVKDREQAAESICLDFVTEYRLGNYQE